MPNMERGRPICMAFSASCSSVQQSEVLSRMGHSLEDFWLHRLRRLESLQLVLQFVLHMDPHALQRQRACSSWPLFITHVCLKRHILRPYRLVRNVGCEDFDRLPVSRNL